MCGEIMIFLLIIFSDQVMLHAKMTSVFEPVIISHITPEPVIITDYHAEPIARLFGKDYFEQLKDFDQVIELSVPEASILNYPITITQINKNPHVITDIQHSYPQFSNDNKLIRGLIIGYKYLVPEINNVIQQVSKKTDAGYTKLRYLASNGADNVMNSVQKVYDSVHTLHMQTVEAAMKESEMIYAVNNAMQNEAINCANHECAVVNDARVYANQLLISGVNKTINGCCSFYDKTCSAAKNISQGTMQTTSVALDIIKSNTVTFAQNISRTTMQTTSTALDVIKSRVTMLAHNSRDRINRIYDFVRNIMRQVGNSFETLYEQFTITAVDMSIQEDELVSIISDSLLDQAYYIAQDESDVVRNLYDYMQIAYQNIQTQAINTTRIECDVIAQLCDEMKNSAIEFTHQGREVISRAQRVIGAGATNVSNGMTYRLGYGYNSAMNGLSVVYHVVKTIMKFITYAIKQVLGVPQTLYAYVGSPLSTRANLSSGVKLVVPQYHTMIKAPSRYTTVIKKVALGPRPMTISASLELRANLEKVLVQLKWRSDFGEMGLQQILNLLNVEIFITDCMIKGDSGLLLSEAVQQRSNLLQSSAPSVSNVYNMILDEATFNNQIDSPFPESLPTNDKKLFLWQVKDKLEYYYSKIQEMQYDISVAS